VAIGGWEKTVQIRDATTGRLLRTLPGFQKTVGSVVWSPDGTRLAAKDWGENIQIWNALSWQVEVAVRCHDERAFAADGSRSLAWSPTGKQLVAGTAKGDLIILDSETGLRLATLGGHTGGVRAVAWSPDGRRLASGGEDRMLRIWDATTGKELLTLDCQSTWIHTVAWSPDGSRLAAGRSEIRIWDAPGMR
jgi:WD40 repeat protein